MILLIARGRWNVDGKQGAIFIVFHVTSAFTRPGANGLLLLFNYKLLPEKFFGKEMEL